MLLSARILVDAVSVNVYRVADVAEFTEGDGPAIYFQLVDTSVDRSDQGFRPSGRRYAPVVGATLVCTIAGINTSKAITRPATQPFVQDPSIWFVQLLPTDPLKGTYDLQLLLTEGVKVTRGVAHTVIHATPQTTSFV